MKIGKKSINRAKIGFLINNFSKQIFDKIEKSDLNLSKLILKFGKLAIFN